MTLHMRTAAVGAAADLEGKSSVARIDLRDSNQPRSAQVPIRITVYRVARLLPHWIGGGRGGYVYSVERGGKLLVDRSRDPEFDACRSLVALGLTGKLTLIDANTGLARVTVDIERGAKLCTSEENRDGLRFRAFRNPDNSRHSPEEASPVPDTREACDG